jgi:hypothetical protein
LAGALLARLQPRRAMPEVWAFAIAYAVPAVAAFAQALLGLPLLAPRGRRADLGEPYVRSL